MTDYIEKVPGVCGGSAVLAGTRIPVWEVVELVKAGALLDNILSQFGGELTTDHLLAALMYAWHHEDEIQALLRESKRVDKKMAEMEIRRERLNSDQ